MKLALIIDDYLPNSTRVGAKMFHELALELRNTGHDITVITPSVNTDNKIKIDTIDSVTVWRFKSGPIKDVDKITRAINETLLSKRAWDAISCLISNDTFEGVIYYSPSIFFGGLVKRIKRRCKCHCYLVLRDFFPQWVIDAGLIRKGSIIEQYFRFFEKKCYKQADKIGLMSEKNLQYFNSLQKGMNSEVLRNWANLNPYKCSANNMSLKARLGIEDKVIFFYGGNIGHAQDMTNIMRLAKNLLPHKIAHILLVGQGDEVDLVEKLISEWSLTNVILLPPVNQDQFKNILTQVDIGLFSLSVNHTAHNFPGKLLGYMVQSIPILGSVNPGNDLLPIFNEAGAGFISVNGEDKTLLSSALKLLNDCSLREAMGKKAYQLLTNKFSVQSATNIILKGLKAADEKTEKENY